MEYLLSITRRQSLAGLMAAGGAVLMPRLGAGAPAAGETGFTHGVASGDPGTDSVVLWTRFLPADTASAAELAVEMSPDPGFGADVIRRSLEARAEEDWCARIPITGLKRGRRYYYRFHGPGGAISPLGRTRTLPADGRPIRIAVVSCSNYPYGFFHVYREIAAREDIDLVLHLGDYIYEYPAGTYGDPRVVSRGRQVKPEGELLTLADYRTRYALYRTDPELLALHAAHPLVAIYDDHEAANDAWRNGAENHQPEEGDWAVRKHAALRAWREWLPVSHAPEAPDDSFYRRITAPGLFDLFILDTRLRARDRQLSYQADMPPRRAVFDLSDPDHPRAVTNPDEIARIPAAARKEIPIPFDMRGEKPIPILDWAQIRALDPKNLPDGLAYLPDINAFRARLENPGRSLLGEEQEAWLADGLADSVAAGTPWQLLGQQVVMGRIVAPELLDIADFSKPSAVDRKTAGSLQALARAGLPLNLDSWDGYPAARERVYAMIRETGARAVVLSGDSHNAWAFDLADRDGRPAAVEFATPAVSSPGLAQYLPVPAEEMARRFVAHNPELVYFEPRWRGWVELAVSPSAVTGRFHFVSEVAEPSYEPVAGDGFVVTREQPARLTRIT